MDAENIFGGVISNFIWSIISRMDEEENNKLSKERRFINSSYDLIQFADVFKQSHMYSQRFLDSGIVFFDVYQKKDSISETHEEIIYNFINSNAYDELSELHSCIDTSINLIDEKLNSICEAIVDRTTEVKDVLSLDFPELKMLNSAPSDISKHVDFLKISKNKIGGVVNLCESCRKDSKKMYNQEATSLVNSLRSGSLVKDVRLEMVRILGTSDTMMALMLMILKKFYKREMV